MNDLLVRLAKGKIKTKMMVGQKGKSRTMTLANLRDFPFTINELLEWLVLRRNITSKGWPSVILKAKC